MQIPSEIKQIRIVSSEIENFLKNKHKLSDSVLFDIRLCIEEAVRNAIVHGNKNKKDLPVLINYYVKDGNFAIEIEDQGKGFDPKKVPNPLTGENLWRAGGRGVFLMHKVMDKVEYNSRGNKVFMVKFIDGNNKEAKNAG